MPETPEQKGRHDTDALPPPAVIATEIADQLEAAFDLFSRIANKLPKSSAWSQRRS